MSRFPPLIPDSCGAAAVEMALVTPLLLIIMCGSIEVGNYFMNEHTLVKGVRDGARYAARQAFANYASCNGTAADVPTPGVTGSANENAKLVVRKGSLNSADSDLLPNWTNGAATFTVKMTCGTAIGTYTAGGIYTGNSVGTANAAPVVTVTASLPYRPILQSFGFRGTGYSLNASEQAAVMGI